MDVIVNDTNIFIDMQALGLLRKMCELPLEIHTVDFIIAEITGHQQRQEIDRLVSEGLIHVRAFSAEEIVDIANEQGGAPGNLSVPDVSVCYYARSGSYVLITGDRQLRNYAEHQSIEVHSILFIFDKLIENQVLSKPVGANKLSELLRINTRLPRNEIAC